MGQGAWEGEGWRGLRAGLFGACERLRGVRRRFGIGTVCTAEQDLLRE